MSADPARITIVGKKPRQIVEGVRAPSAAVSGHEADAAQPEVCKRGGGAEQMSEQVAIKTEVDRVVVVLRGPEQIPPGHVWGNKRPKWTRLDVGEENARHSPWLMDCLECNLTVEWPRGDPMYDW